MRTSLRNINDHGVTYQALMFVCPGCALAGGSGIHMLPVNSTTKTPQWDWDGNLEEPTLTPSILSRGAPFRKGRSEGVCHSFLRGGVFEFLSDCTHQFAGQNVPMPDLPEWAPDQ